MATPSARQWHLGPALLLMLLCSALVVAAIVLPLLQMVMAPTLEDMLAALKDRDVMRAIGLSMKTAGMAGVIALVIGTPFAYLLARKHFRGKRLVESIVDLPIMIPHPIIGIALLSLAGKGHWLGDLFRDLGIQVMGTETGIVAVMTFVGLPFYINAAKAGFEAVPRRLEHVSRSLGASLGATFFRVTLPLAWRAMLAGCIMCIARAVSEFGAIIIVAYHPMVAPVMIYERFTAYGLRFSQPVAVWLILVSLLLFAVLRIVSVQGGARR